MVKPIQQRSVYFVLGTGRMGSSFLYQLIQRAYPGIACAQEPCQGWLFNFYSHFRAQGLLNPWILRGIQNQFLWTRNHLLRRDAGEKYIEVTPYLYALTDTIREALGEMRILHIVRHPLTYIPSTLNFQPRTWRAYTEKLPAWHLNVSRSLPEQNIKWGKLTDLEKKAWFWTCANQQISAAESYCSKYLRIRFEDLFSANSEMRKETMQKVLSFFDLKANQGTDSFSFNRKINPSRRRLIPPWQQWDPRQVKAVLDICGELMDSYGYRTTDQLPLSQAEFGKESHETGILAR